MKRGLGSSHPVLVVERARRVVMGEETRAGRPKRSRRELLAGAAGAAGVIAAQTVVGATPAYAGVDGDVVLGIDNQSTAGTTGVSSSAVTGLHGKTTATGLNDTGVFGEGPVGVHGTALTNTGVGVLGTGGEAGVQGNGSFYGAVGIGGPVGVHGSGSSDGVEGFSSNGDGVYGESSSSGSGSGVHGVNDAGGKGIFGEALIGTGVVGNSNGGDGVEGQTNGAFNTGVYGHNESFDAGGKGVFGASPNGIAVEGLGGQVGVHGISAGDTGVKGEGVGIGVRAVSTLANHAGVGLRVDGRLVFRTAGVATVPSGKNTVSVSLAGVTATDMVLATVQQGGAFYVKNAVASSGKFAIHLNKAPVSPATVKVAWFVISAS
jgi:hypothetical protein